MASSHEDVQPVSRRGTQEVDCEVNKSWAAVYQSVARRMLSYLDNSEALKEGTKEFAPKKTKRQHRAHCEASER